MIYTTPYRGDTLQTTGESLDSGFESLEAVREALGEPLTGGAKWLSYGVGNDRVAFSTFPFNIGPVVVPY